MDKRNICKVLVLLLLALSREIGLPISSYSQLKIADAEHNGLYKNKWRYKNDRYLNTLYASVMFINDSIFIYSTNSNKQELGFNRVGYFYGCVGRSLFFNGKRRWFMIRDDANIGFFYDLNEFDSISNVGRLDLNEALNVDWNSPRYNKAPSKNDYDIYEVRFFKDSMKIISFRTTMPDNGDLGMHYRLKKRLGNYFPLSIDKDQIPLDQYFEGSIKKNCTTKYIPIHENIKTIKTPYYFKAHDKVLIHKIGYMKYTFIVTLDKNNKVVKYGWVLRTNLAK